MVAVSGTYVDRAQNAALDEHDIAEVLTDGKVVKLSNDHHCWFFRRTRDQLRIWMENINGGFCYKAAEAWNVRIIQRYVARTHTQEIRTTWPGDRR